MEEIYTIRVKCEPRPGLAYPSERAYSSSTVGGLAVAHLILAFLSFTLSAPAYTVRASTVELGGGGALVLGACLAGLAGILASKRWYLDRHIRWFFITSFISMVTSLTAAIITAFVIFCPPHPIFTPIFFINFNKSYLNLNNTNTTEVTTSSVGIGTVRKEIYFHMLISTIFEFIISFQSLRIAWTGIKNTGCKSSRIQNPGGIYNFETQKQTQSEKKIDSRLSNYSNVVKELCRLQKNALIGDGQIGKKIVTGLYNGSAEMGNGLPLPESQKEYQQRMEKFLASHHIDKES